MGGTIHTHTDDQDGWLATTSDEEDYLRLTQSYVDGCQDQSKHGGGEMEDDVFGVKEDDIGQKEDDLMESDSSDEDRNGYITIEELLRSFREVEDGNQPSSRLVHPVSPPPDQPKQVGGVDCVRSDSIKGAANTTTEVVVTEICRDMTRTNHVVGGATFARSVDVEDMRTQDGASCSEKDVNTTKSQTEDTQDTQLCPPGSEDSSKKKLRNATPTPSRDRNTTMATDKLSDIDITNPSTLDTVAGPDAMTDQPDDAAPTEDTGHDRHGSQRGVADRMTENDRRIPGGGVYTMESRRNCQHDEEGVCSIHGPGALWRQRPGKKITTRGKDGRKKFTMTKEYYWICDLGAGGRRLSQSRISFGTPTARREGRTRDMQGYLGLGNATEGQ